MKRRPTRSSSLIKSTVYLNSTECEEASNNLANKQPREKILNNHSTAKTYANEIQILIFKTSPPLNSANTVNQFLSNSKIKMDKVNGIDMEFIYKKRGHSPETKSLWVERNHILKPDKTRIVGKGKDSERIQEYRPNQSGRKRIAELNIEIYNRFFQFCETLGTTPLWEYQQNNNESWLHNNQSDGESEISRTKLDKCPTSALKKFEKHETVNLIRLKQTAFNQAQADLKEKLTKHKSKREHRGGNQTSRKRFCVRPPPFGRRNGTRCKDPECNRRYRKTTIRQHILPIPSPSITSFYSLRTIILQ